jgi:preprotein translocase subunit YajC
MGVTGKLFLALLFSAQVVLAEGTPASALGRDGLSPIVPVIMMFGVFYFLILRPQQKRQKDQQRFITELKRGDMVVTQSGIIGTIKTVGEKFVTLEIDQGVSLKILKSAILESAANLKDEKNSSQKEATT